MSKDITTVGADSVAFGYEALAVLDDAVCVLTSSEYVATAPARQCRALITVETHQLRYTLEGTAPSSTVGHLIEIGDVLVIEGAANIALFKCISTTTDHGAIKVTYFQYY